MRVTPLVVLCAISLARADEQLATRTREVYAAFAAAASAIPWDDGTVDRPTILARLASEPDPTERRRYFEALAPVWASIAGEGGGASPYAELVALRKASWSATGATPFE